MESYWFWGDTPAQWFMAGLGLVATGLSGWAVYLLRKTLKATDVAAIASASAANAANDTVKAAREQIALMEAQSRREHVAAHRPHLRLKFVSSIRLQDDMEPVVNLTFANIGGSDATIDRIGVDIWIRQDDRWIPGGPDHPLNPYTDKETRNSIVIAGGERKMLLDIAGSQPIAAHHYKAVFDSIIDLALVGEVRYRDEFGTLRHTGFFRVYDVIHNEFVRVEHDRASGRFVKTTRVDYDYEE